MIQKQQDKQQTVTFSINSEPTKEFVKGKNIFEIKIKELSEKDKCVLVTGIRSVVDHLRKLGYEIPKDAIVSSFNQSEQAYEYMGKANTNIDADI